MRTAGVYAGVSWVVLQVVDTLIDNLELPRSIFIATLILLGVGFVVVLATAWVQSRPGLSERAQAEEVPEAWEFDGSDLVLNGEGGSPLVSQLLALAAESAHTELGQWEDALRYARSARADAFATFRQAKLYEQLGQPDEARRLYPLVLHALEGADPDVPEVAEARERLAALGGG